MRTLIAALLAVIAVAVGYLAWDAYRDEARAEASLMRARKVAIQSARQRRHEHCVKTISAFGVARRDQATIKAGEVAEAKECLSFINSRLAAAGEEPLPSTGVYQLLAD